MPKLDLERQPSPARSATLTLKKSTKGTHVYECGDPSLSIYFPRAMVGGDTPHPRVKITVRPALEDE